MVSGDAMYTSAQKRKSPTAPTTIPFDDDSPPISDMEGSNESSSHHHGGNYTRRGSPSQMSMSPFKNWGARHTLTVLGFLGFASSYSMRVNLSIAIVQMVNNSHASSHHNHSAGVVMCPELVGGEMDRGGGDGEADNQHFTGSRHPRFDWSQHDQGIILGSFFYGYVITQVPGGILSNKIGGKWVFGVGMLVTALFSLVTPMAANAGIPYLVAVRILQGLGEGVTNPSMHALLAQWAPPLERSIIGAFVYAGAQMGTVIALPISGWLLENENGNLLTSGWPSVFYVFGLLGIVWFLFWALLVYDSPSCHPRISIEERVYIQAGQGKVGCSSASGGGSRGVRGGTPWRKLATSGAVWAILVTQTGHGWGLYTMLTELPKYMDEVLHFEIKQNAYLSALPYFLMWVVSIASSYYADKMRTRGISTGIVRKIFNTIAHWIPAVLLVLAAQTTCDRSVSVALITLAIGLTGANCASFQVNHIDLSPNHAAVMMGITNGFANLCGIGAPYVAGVILNGGSTVSHWRIIFYIAAVVYLIDNLVYLFLAKGEVQEWDNSDSVGDRVFREYDSGISSVDVSGGRGANPGTSLEDREPLLHP